MFFKPWANKLYLRAQIETRPDPLRGMKIRDPKEILKKLEANDEWQPHYHKPCATLTVTQEDLKGIADYKNLFTKDVGEKKS